MCVMYNIKHLLIKFITCKITEIKKYVNDNSELAYLRGSSLSKLLQCLENRQIHKVRAEGNEEIFQLCAEMCFPWMISKNKWKNNHQYIALSQLITIADEALALVILENNYLEWIEIGKGMQMNKDQRLTKYTHARNNSNGTKKGWSLEGRLRFNEIFDETKIQREKTASKQMEGKLKAMWHDTNPVNRRNRNTDYTEDQRKQLEEAEAREARYVPRTDFDFE